MDKTKPSSIIIGIFSFLFLYLVLPIFLTVFFHDSFLRLVLFYLAIVIIAICLFKKNALSRSYQEIQAQRIREKINILNSDSRKELQNKSALKEKISRYTRLKDILEELNHNLTLDYIADKLASLSFSIIAENKGTCLLYLEDSKAEAKLSLFKSRKEDVDLIIKNKEGDIFDLWVLKHTNPLLIEDIKKDFRFDLEKLESKDKRPISSLVSSPFISEQRFLGLLRLDNPAAGFYSQDDLRLLVAICDLGAVALEDGELFEETQELAIRDGLTSLYRKEYFLERLKEECKRAARQGSVFSLLMLDIDYFKNYNDRFGHTAGDIVLKDLSRHLVNSLKDLGPVIGRFGGEEFCIILPQLDKKKAAGIAEKLRLEIEKMKIILRRTETRITISVGVATFGRSSGDENELILKADRAMYEAKQKGRNRVITA